MKKLWIVVVFAALLLFGLSACKSHSPCPAYGQESASLSSSEAA